MNKVNRTSSCGAILCSLLAMHAAGATSLGPSADVPATFALVELCNERHPEYRERNEAAMAAWIARNEAAVQAARQAAMFPKGVQMVKGLFAGSAKPERLKEGCRTLESELGRR